MANDTTIEKLPDGLAECRRQIHNVAENTRFIGSFLFVDDEFDHAPTMACADALFRIETELGDLITQSKALTEALKRSRSVKRPKELVDQELFWQHAQKQLEAGLKLANEMADFFPWPSSEAKPSKANSDPAKAQESFANAIRIFSSLHKSVTQVLFELYEPKPKFGGKS